MQRVGGGRGLHGIVPAGRPSTRSRRWPGREPDASTARSSPSAKRTRRGSGRIPRLWLTDPFLGAAGRLAAHERAAAEPRLRCRPGFRRCSAGRSRHSPTCRATTSRSRRPCAEFLQARSIRYLPVQYRKPGRDSGAEILAHRPVPRHDTHARAPHVDLRRDRCVASQRPGATRSRRA